MRCDRVNLCAVTRAVACPDKFRGTLRADEAAAAIAAGLTPGGFDDVVELPLADGGEGTLDTLLAARGGSRRTARVTGPLGDPVDARVGCAAGGVAIIEMAQASGLALVSRSQRSVAREHARHRRADRGACARRASSASSSRSAEARRPTAGSAAVEALGWSLAGHRGDGRVRRRDAVPRRGARLRTAEGRDRRADRVADAPPADARRSVPHAHRRRRDARSTAAARRAGSRAGSPRSARELVPGLRRGRGSGRASKPRSRAPTSSSPARASSTRRASRARSSAACSRGPPTSTSPTVAVIAGQVTDDARAALAERAGVQVLALTDRVWQPARRSRAPRCSSRKPH